MKHSAISWTTHTFNAWEGCAKVSPGCANCYAETLVDTRFGRVRWGRGQPRRRTSAAYWRQPIAWNREAAAAQQSHEDQTALGFDIGVYRRPRVFCASLSDWLDDEVPAEWLADLLDLIRRTPHLDWLLLTKRPEKWRHRIEAALATVSEKPDAFTCDSAANSEWWNLRCWLDGDPPLNVWIGATVEDRQRAEDRIPKLLAIPTKLRFLSCEPLLGSLDLTRVTFPTGVAENVLRHQTDGTIIVPIAGVHWIIAGGESGPNARPMHPDWPRCLRDQCATANIPFHFKQWGEWLPVSQWVDAVSDIDPDDWNHLPQFIFPESFGVISHRCGKHRAGRLLDGVLHDAVPSV